MVLLKCVVGYSDFANVNQELQNLKIIYIPQCAKGLISISQCAKKIGITARSVCRLKKRYAQYGDSIFVHGNTGRTPQNKRYDYNAIVEDYKKFDGTPFASFRDDCADYLHYERVPSYTTVYNALSGAGIVSPRARIPVREKKKHLPRKERPNEGDLVQIDGCLHDWFMTGEKCTLHGAIDDATHQPVALYFCRNECLLGYYKMLSLIKDKTGGFPRAIYSDRSSCFFVTKDAQATVQEQLEGMEKAETQWQKTCRELGIELIAARSPEAKGRIERLWETLQGRLPYIFRFLGIDTMEKANGFLADFLKGFNARFAVEAQDKELHWQAPPEGKDFDLLFSVKAEKKVRKDGHFIYHGYLFSVPAITTSGTKFTLCLSENFGLRAYRDGRYYNVELAEPLCDVAGEAMPKVEKDLLYRYFYADTHSGWAVVG